jgi:ankyrin repeat protein
MFFKNHFRSVDDLIMMNRNPFFTAFICGIVTLTGLAAGCATKPPAPEAEPEPVNVLVEDDVWTLLARGENEKARRYFLGEVDVNAADPQGRTPLHLAAENKDPVLAAFFISLGADVNALDRQDQTALDISAGKLDGPTAKVFAGAGSDIHHSPAGNPSAAGIGVTEGGEFLQAILTPASLESTDASGRTILHLAADAGNTPALNSILNTIPEAGKNVLGKKDNLGKTALDIALERTDSRNHAEAAECLILAGAVSDNPLYDYFAPAVRSSNYNIRSADGMAPLHYIAGEGYTGYIDFVLENNANVNIKNASGATPLHEAVRSGNVRVMEILLDHGAEINAQDAKGNSVLHIAVPPQSHKQALDLFLSRGVNPNLRDEHGDSAIHIAIILNRDAGIIGSLLAAGGDVTIRNIDGETPLYTAIVYRRENLIPLLLQYKSDIFAADNNGVTPYEKAFSEDNALVYSLITGETVLQNDSQGNTVLHHTVRLGGDTGIIGSILDRGANVNARNKEGDTSLHIAVRLNEYEAGGLLLSRGADIFAPNARGESPLRLSFPLPGKDPSGLRRWMITPYTLTARDGLGNTALHYLAQWQFNNWIPLVIQQGAATEAANATGETPLFTAVKIDAPVTIHTLVANGAALEGRDTLGNTALHAAVRWNAMRAAEALIDLGLDINAHALNGKTPLHDAVRLGLTDMEGLLLSYNADIEVRDAEGNTPFIEAILAGFPDTMERLVDKGADLNIRNFRGDTPLHIAAAMERNDIAVMLLSWGAAIHARNSYGRTPYQNALLTSPEMVKTFLTKDRLHVPDDNGSSPLHIAIQERCQADIIRTILGLGARTSALDSEGRNPLRLAVELNEWTTAKILADSGSDVFLTARDGRCSADIVLAAGGEAVRTLFSGKAINSKDSSGNTILHYAAKNGNTAVITLLIEMGANKGIKNIAAESPADIAQRWKHAEAVSLLN